MTNETMHLRSLLEKTTDPDFLREMIGFTAQRLMALQNPKIAALKIEDLIDSRFVLKLDEKGFIDELYRADPSR